MGKFFKGMGLFGLAALALFFFISYSAAEAPMEFSANMVSRTSEGTVSGKIYCAGQKMRTETPDAIMIVRLDKNLSWMIMPAEQMYMEQAIDRNALPRTSQHVAGEIERVSMGKEEVNGQSTEKFKVTYKEGTAQLVMYQWVADSGFPVKMEAADGSWSVEYKNIVIGPQSASLFEVPAGYQMMTVPIGMPYLKDMIEKMGQE